MAKLIKNVRVDGTWYGPAHGNADRVPAEVAEGIGPHAWAEYNEAPADPPAPDPDSVPDGNVDTVLAWVNGGANGDPLADGWRDRAEAALEAEIDGKGRKGILDTLGALLGINQPQLEV